MLNPETFCRQYWFAKLSEKNSTDLWNCLFAKFSILKLEVLVSTNFKNYGTLPYEKKN